MAKTKSVYFCTNCGAESPKWVGRCLSCGDWNTYQEEKITTGKTKPTGFNKEAVKIQRLSEVVANSTDRISTHDIELDRVLGGGIVPGSLILIGGEPGIGKSTLLLDVALRLSIKVLYISGEESTEQIKLRAARLKNDNKDCFFLPETNVESIETAVEDLKPELIIVDSIQTLYTHRLEFAPGNVSQLRESTASLLKLAKSNNIPIFLIGHITKDGSIAGPKVLEHMVDTVLQFEGDRNLTYRILRTLKNRFGSTAEIGIYEMQVSGLKPVTNPSEMLVSSGHEEQSGSAIGLVVEGNRPLLIEVQALVGKATYGTPQRSATGYDTKRLNMHLAVLEKRLRLNLGDKDVFLNVVGGLRIQDPSLDLAVVVAIISSYTDKVIPHYFCFCGEIGLGGEVRKINRIEERIKEAVKLGYHRICTARFNLSDTRFKDVQIHQAGKLTDVFKTVFN